MKNAIKVIVSIIIAVSLCGCSVISDIIADTSVETQKDCSFQYNEETKDYSLFFGLYDKSDNAVSTDVTAEIRIVNDNDDEVYKSTKSVEKDDFGYYSSLLIEDEQLLAEIKISSDEIAEGKSEQGTIHLTIYNDTFKFDELDFNAFCLPTKDIELSVGSLPTVISIKDYSGAVESKIQIDDVAYEYESSQLKITISGKKTYGKNSYYDIIGYKLYDSNDYLVDSGNVFLNSLEQGDKFKDDSICVYGVEAGENYKLKLSESNY